MRGRADWAAWLVAGGAALALVAFGRPAGWVPLLLGLAACFQWERGHFLGPLAGQFLLRGIRRRRLGPAASLASLLALALAEAVWFRTFFSDWFAWPLAAPNSTREFLQTCWSAILLLAGGLTWFGAAVSAAALFARERERRTLDFLLMADLSGRELVIGKLAAWGVPLLYLALGTLPTAVVLAAADGTPVALLLLGIGAALATAASLGGLGMLCSVGSSNEGRAGGRALLAVLGYLAGITWVVRWALPSLGAAGGWWTWAAGALDGPVAGLDAGSPVHLAERLAPVARSGDALWQEALTVLPDYLLFHGLLFVGSVLLAARRLRRAEVRTNDPTGEARRPPRPPRLPPVSARPVLWRAMHLDGRWARGATARVVFAAAVAASFVPLMAFLLAQYRGPTVPAGAINVWLRAGGVAASLVLWMMVLQTATRSFGRERDAGTLDELLLTDLTPRELVAQKWLGAFWPGRWPALWLAVHWVAGVLTGELWIGALPGLVLLTAAVTAALSGLGVWLSVPRRPSQLANSEAMGAVFAFLGVVWGAWWLPSRFLSESHWLPELLLRQAVVLTPPALVGLLTCTPAEARWFLGRSDASWWLAQSAAGMALAVGAAWWLWRRACAAADREFRPRPERRKEVPT